MNKPLNSKLWYAKTWDKFKHFPSTLSQGSQQIPTVSGPAAAALVSASFSCFVLMVNQHLSTMFKTWDNFLHPFFPHLPLMPKN